MPKITCIMPVYNTAKYLDECILSILNQTFSDFEFIISDDGSTDGSKEIIKKYSEIDPRIVFLDNSKNRGICANLNDMINIAKGEFIAIMESDDISIIDRFEKTMDSFNKDPKIDLVGSQGMLCNANGKIYLNDFLDLNIDFSIFQERYLFKHTFVAPTVTFRKNIIDIVGLFQYDRLWDFYFYSKVLFCESKYFKCINSNFKGAIKRVHSDSLGRSKFIKIEKLYRELRLKLIKDYNLEKKQKNLIIKTKIIFYQRIFIYIISTFLQKVGLYEIVSSLYQKVNKLCAFYTPT